MRDDSMRVIHVTPLGADGITSFVLNVVPLIKENGIITDYITFQDGVAFYEKKALSYGGKKFVVPIKKYGNSFLRAIYKFILTIMVLKKNNETIIHINASSPYDILVGLSARIAGVKVIVFHSHTSGTVIKKKKKLMVDKLCRYLIPYIADYCLACSELAAEFMYPMKLKKNKKYITINNGININEYLYNESKRLNVRKKMNLEKKFVIGHVGRFVKVKNHVFMIEILYEFLNLEPNAMLLLVGCGELEEEIKKRVYQLKMENHVIFAGERDDVPELLQAMDCFLLPSYYEGLPVVGIEAQAAGLPIVMADTISKEVAITDLVKFYSLEKNAKEWAECIWTFYNENRHRKDTSKEIKSSGFDIIDVANRLCEIYKENI